MAGNQPPTAEEILARARSQDTSGSRPVPPEVTESEEHAMRDEFERTIRGRNGKRLHLYIESKDLPLCETEQAVSSQSKWRNPEPFDAFPVGIKPVCRRCGQVWRENREGDDA